MIGADREMQGVAGAQAQCVLLDETSRCAELQPRHRHHCKALRGQPVEHGQRIRAVSVEDDDADLLDIAPRVRLGFLEKSLSLHK